MTIRSFEGKYPQIHDDAFIDESAVVIGDVSIGEGSSIWPCCVVRGDIHTIKIGKRTNIQDGSILHVTHASDYVPGGSSLSIGDDVTVGHGAVIHACTIKNEVLIGMNATVLDRAVVNDQVMVGAGAVVSPGKALESGYLYVGSPAKQARPLTDKEKAFLKYSANNYASLKDRHVASQQAEQQREEG